MIILRHIHKRLTEWQKLRFEFDLIIVFYMVVLIGAAMFFIKCPTYDFCLNWLLK